MVKDATLCGDHCNKQRHWLTQQASWKNILHILILKIDIEKTHLLFLFICKYILYFHIIYILYFVYFLDICFCHIYLVYRHIKNIWILFWIFFIYFFIYIYFRKSSYWNLKKTFDKCIGWYLYHVCLYMY